MLIEKPIKEKQIYYYGEKFKYFQYSAGVINQIVNNAMSDRSFDTYIELNDGKNKNGSIVKFKYDTGLTKDTIYGGFYYMIEIETVPGIIEEIQIDEIKSIEHGSYSYTVND